MASPRPADAVVLDLDGTLVDSVYVHVHVLAWQAAFATVGVEVAGRVLHRTIGMGGDRLVAHVAGDDVEAEHGDVLRKRHPHELDRLFDRIVETPGASRLLRALHDLGVPPTLASSSDGDLTDRLLGLVDAGDLLERVGTGSDASTSKPDGEILRVVLDGLDADHPVVIGDAVWDVRAAIDAGVPCLGVLTGGVSEAELREAGAVRVYADLGGVADAIAADGALLV